MTGDEKKPDPLVVTVYTQFYRYFRILDSESKRLVYFLIWGDNGQDNFFFCGAS